MDVDFYWLFIEIFFTLAVFSFLTFILVKISRKSIHHDLQARDTTKGHHWTYSEAVEQVTLTLRLVI